MTVSAPAIAGSFTIALWSVTSAVLVLTAPVPPFMVGAFSFLSAFAAVAAWWISKGDDIPSKFRMPVKTYALGLYGMLAYNAIYIYAFKTGPSLEVNLLNYLWPAVLVFANLLIQRKRPSLNTLAGIVLCVAGSFFVFESRGDLHLDGGQLTLWLGLLAAMLWGSYSAMSRYADITADRIAVFMLMAGLGMLALHLSFEETAWPVSALGWTMLFVYAGARACFFTWDYALKRGKIEAIASLSYFIPLFSTLSLWAIGKTDFNNLLFAGAALIIAGCLVVNFKSLQRGFSLLRTGAAA